MTNYQVHLSAKSQRDIKKLDSTIRPRIIKAITKLSKNRTPQQFKPLMGKDIAQFRIRIGDYRILYDVYDYDKTVLIICIGHRKDIYR
jgi:mRNA interferase RelE/StbE